jgi:hypothetical protein
MDGFNLSCKKWCAANKNEGLSGNNFFTVFAGLSWQDIMVN